MKTNIKQRISAWTAIAAIVGVVLSPAIASAAFDDTNQTINAIVDPVISIGTGPAVDILLTPTSGGVLSNDSDTVTVDTNNATGYNLEIEDGDATRTLANGGNSFAASTGTKTTPIALLNNTWGFAVNTGTTGIGTNGFDASYGAESNSASSTSLWAGMPANGAPIMLKTTSTTAVADTTTVWFAAKATTSLPSGTYTDQIVYTATTN